MGAANNDRGLPALPPPAPTSVLLGSDDDSLVRRLDKLTASEATAFDLRSGAMWSDVPDGRAFLSKILAEVSNKREHIRFAFAKPGSSAEQLLQRALLAPSLAQLSDALERAELSAEPPTYAVHYQPLVSLVDRKVIGFEGLIRAEAKGRPVDAEDLFARASRGQWIGELDQLCRSIALRGVGPWLGEGLLFLNVLAPDGSFDEESVQSTVDDAISAGLDPDQIVLEAVERNRYDDLDAATTQIERFRSLGVRIAVDDVGDGFSSLRVVSAFKPDVVKVAGHLVSALPSAEARAIIRAIVTLAHDTGTWVVAENIESEQQVRELTGLGVDWGQGHHLGAPTSRQQAVRTTGERPRVVRV